MNRLESFTNRTNSKLSFFDQIETWMTTVVNNVKNFKILFEFKIVNRLPNPDPSSYAAAVLKLYTIERKSFNMSVMKKIVDYLKGAYVDGKLQKNYEDIDSVRAGIPEGCF